MSIWERRQLWKEGKPVRVEWWRDDQMIASVPPRGRKRWERTTDYCDAHYTRIYTYLPCAYCG